jgi:hypothetical protein
VLGVGCPVAPSVARRRQRSGPCWGSRAPPQTGASASLAPWRLRLHTSICAADAQDKRGTSWHASVTLEGNFLATGFCRDRPRALTSDDKATSGKSGGFIQQGIRDGRHFFLPQLCTEKDYRKMEACMAMSLHIPTCSGLQSKRTGTAISAFSGPHSGSGPLLVIVEREVPYTAYGHDVREVKHVRHATGSHACTTLTRTARPSRWPRRRSGTPGVIPQPHLWRHASLRGLGFCKGS